MAVEAPVVRHPRNQGMVMVDALAALVASESPSGDHGARSSTADVISEIGAAPLGETPERLLVDGRPHLRWRSGSATPVSAAEVGGGSGGDFTAAVGGPTLHGLSAVGGGAHAGDAHVDTDAMPLRAALLGGVIDDVLER